MGNEQSERATSTWATVAIATGAIAFKQAAVDGQPIEFVSVLLGAGLVIGYLNWRRRQGDPGLTPERLAQTDPAPVGVAAAPGVATIVIGTFCLVHWFFAFMLLTLYFALNNKRAKAATGGEAATPPLSQVLGELLIFDGEPRKPDPSLPPLPTPTPVVREVTPSRALKPAAEPLRAVVAEPPADAPEPVTEVAPTPWGMTGLSLTTPSTLGTGTSLTLESRLPSILETRLAPSTDTLGMNRGASGFDEALALLQGKQASEAHPD